MKTINHKQLGKLIKKHYETRIPLFCWGATGIGKSEVVKETAKEIANNLGKEFVMGKPNDEEKEFGFIDMRFSDKDISDIKGLPFVEKVGDKKVTKWIVPEDIPVDDNSHGIIVFEEFNLAPPAVQATGYQLLRERRLGVHELSKNWVIIATGNRLEDEANVYEMAAPLNNRFGHCELAKPTKEDWTDWAIDNKLDNRVITFINFKGHEVLCPQVKRNERAQPSPRTWEYCSNSIIDVKSKDLDDLELYASVIIGEGASKELASFIKLNEEIDLNELLKKPNKVNELEIDMKYAVIGALTDKYRNELEKPASKRKIMKGMLNIANNLEPEFAMLLMRYAQKLGGKKFETDTQKKNPKAWSTFAEKHIKYFRKE